MSDIMILAAGENCIRLAEKVRCRAQKEGMDFTLVNARFLKPLDEDLLNQRNERFVITLEDNVVRGGLGDAIKRFYTDSNKTVFSFGYDDRFIPHGEPTSLAKKHGLDEEDVLSCVRKLHARG